MHLLHVFSLILLSQFTGFNAQTEISSIENTTVIPATCEDKYPVQCATEAWKNLCSVSNAIQVNCAATCNTCSVTPQQIQCVDTDEELCQTHNESTCLVSIRVQKACPKTCNVCEEVTTVCKDTEGMLCNAQLCQLPSTKSVMESNCKKTCGLCPGDTPIENAEIDVNEVCTDILPGSGCSMVRDNCEKNTVKKVCAKTCGACEEVLKSLLNPEAIETAPPSEESPAEIDVTTSSSTENSPTVDEIETSSQESEEKNETDPTVSESQTESPITESEDIPDESVENITDSSPLTSTEISTEPPVSSEENTVSSTVATARPNTSQTQDKSSSTAQFSISILLLLCSYILI